MKTVRVRIAVAVSDDLSWSASGWSSNDKRYDVAAKDSAVDSVPRSVCAVHFIEADVPVPEPMTISGEVSS